VASDEVPVTIVGGGPVGLSMALALARFGVRSRVLEQKETTTDHPKARGLFPRAMEIFRQWGIEPAVRARGLPPGSDSFAVLDGLERELGRTPPEPFQGQGPARKSTVAQDAVEEALVARLAAFPQAQVLWNTRARSGDIGDSGATITAEDVRTGSTSVWRSPYVIGADGGAGFAARLAGIDYEGPPQLALMLNTYFRADLSAFETMREVAGMIFTRHDGYAGAPYTFLNTNGADRWLLLERIGSQTDERPRPPTEAETIATLRAVLRQPNLDIRIINQAVWRLTRRIASRFREGPVFLAGDAAHRFPPTGGLGLNSGIEDVHNLAWKLAFVLQGKASGRLLDTYDRERRPIANANADMALLNGARFQKFTDAAVSGNPDKLRFWLNDMANHTNSIGHVLGFVYGEGALIPDGSTPPPRTPRTYSPTDRPGSRFPHFWLDPERTRFSLDLFDDDMVLVVGRSADAWARAAEVVSRRRNLAIRVHRLGETDPAAGIAMGATGAALVRPDGVTAWRIGWPESDPQAALGAAMDAILG
jgi:putative polyketide hydroxylase/tetracenomycin A2 monooxygenase-dioxygenase